MSASKAGQAGAPTEIEIKITPKMMAAGNKAWTAYCGKGGWDEADSDDLLRDAFRRMLVASPLFGQLSNKGRC